MSGSSRRRAFRSLPLIPRPTALSLLSPSATPSPTSTVPITTTFTPPPPSTAVRSLFKEPQAVTHTPNHPSNTSYPKNLETLLPPAPMLPPLFMDSIAELKDLSVAIASYRNCYEDLRKHLDSIKDTISSKKLPPETPHAAPIAPSASDGTESKEQEQESNTLVSDVEEHCKKMCSRGIRRYLLTHLSELAWMREEVPRALRLAPNPPKLVLDSVGKFYLQSSNAISANPTCFPARKASIFILECFLLMMGMDTDSGDDNGVLSIDEEVKADAEVAALSWRKRMVVEGGLEMADPIDVRGLLFLVACFGIPRTFDWDDIRVLLAAANTKEIVGVLRKSNLLMNKIPDIVVGMLKHNMEIDAVNLVYTFELEEKFDTQKILGSYLLESKESWKTAKSCGPLASLNEAAKKQLAALKSVHMCLKRNNVDPAKLLPGWRIHEKITTLEKHIGRARTSTDRPFLHRKVSETETLRKPITSHEPKRARYMAHGPQQHRPTDRGRSRGYFPSRGQAKHRPYNHPCRGEPGEKFQPESSVPPARVHGGAMTDRRGGVMSRWDNPYPCRKDFEVSSESSPLGVGSTGLYRSPVVVESRSCDLNQFDDAVGECDSPNV